MFCKIIRFVSVFDTAKLRVSVVKNEKSKEYISECERKSVILPRL